MALDFPASPTNGQKYPASPVAGIPTYTWDGEKWTTAGPAVGALYVAKAGDTMTGPLVLSGDPTANLGAATKQYAVAKAGDTMSGPLVLPADPTVNLQASTKQYVDAGDVAGLAASGMQINGGMEISQERGMGVATAVNGSYVCDGWTLFYSGTVVANGAAAAGALTPGFPNFLFLSVVTAQASMGSTDYTFIRQGIEGYRIARLGWGTANAKPITINFWSSHHRTGVYSGVVRNGAGNRTYAFTYTQNASDSVQYNTITIPGDTTGTWATDNTVGMHLILNMACGSANIAPSVGTWLAGNYAAAPGQINGVAATSDVFRITGVVVLPGTQAPTAAQSPLIMRPYDQELQLCRRYYYKRAISLLANVSTGSGSSGTWFAHPVQMRASPSMTTSGGTATNAAHAIDTSSIEGYRHFLSATAPGDASVTGAVDVADARL